MKKDNKDIDCKYSIEDLPYLRKRITQLEMKCVSKDLKYRKLQNDYRRTVRKFRKLLELLGADKNAIKECVGQSTSIGLKDISEELSNYVKKGNMGRKYYNDQYKKTP